MSVLVQKNLGCPIFYRVELAFLPWFQSSVSGPSHPAPSTGPLNVPSLPGWTVLSRILFFVWSSLPSLPGWTVLSRILFLLPSAWQLLHVPSTLFKRRFHSGETWEWSLAIPACACCARTVESGRVCSQHCWQACVPSPWAPPWYFCMLTQHTARHFSVEWRTSSPSLHTPGCVSSMRRIHGK